MKSVGILEKVNLFNSGIYLLIIKTERKISVRVGALGRIVFEKGYYVYIGSAQKNLIERIKRHIRREKTRKWHIDYLTTHKEVKTIGAYIIFAQKDYECKISEILNRRGIPVPNFGCSDCKCLSHLTRLNFN